MRGWSTALAILVVLAGCVGSPKDEDVSAAAVDASATGSAGTSSSAAAGSAASGASPAASAGSAGSTEASAPPPAPVVVPLTFAGHIPTFAEACAFTIVAGECATAPPGQQFEMSFPIEQAGNITAWSLTMTWTATSPATDDLGLFLVSHNDDFSTVVEHASAFGPSPLALDVAPGSTLDPALTHTLFVTVGGTGGGALVAFAFVAAAQEQDFTLDGSMTLLPAAPPP